jgi:methylated-DNA-[protein]-cysteine S-methyltransferase
MSGNIDGVGSMPLESAIEPTRIRIPSPVGTLGIELTGEILTRIVIVPKGRERNRFRDFAELKRSERSDFLDEVLGRFSEYFAGARRNLNLQYDLKATGVEGLARRALKQTAKIPYGKTRTYRQIAESAGNPEAYRQVLSALLVNPLPLVIPCHRVVTTKSGVGSYIAGTRKKAWLLKLEERTVAIENLDDPGS